MQASTTSSSSNVSPRFSSLCAFWLGERRYALPTSLIEAVVAIETVAPVPLAPAAVLGVISLRGAPVALVDLVTALDLPIAQVASRELALVMRRDEGVLAAISIDRMDAVLAAGQHRYTPRNDQVEHPAVQGFLERGPGDVLTVLDPDHCLEQINQLKFR